MVVTGIYDCGTGKNELLQCNTYNKSFNGKSIVVICDNFVNTPDYIASLYLDRGSECVYNINSLFIIISADSTGIHIMCDPYGSQWNLFYYVKGGLLYYSTSMKALLSVCPITRTLNKQTAKIFLKRGFLIDGQTLITDIKCLTFAQELYFNQKGIHVQQYKYKFKRCSCTIADARNLLIPTIKDSILSYYSSADNCVSLPLSNGYDSNLIFNTIREKCIDKDIKVFTIGGVVGRNEIPAVKENIKGINGVLHYTDIVDKELLRSFPDIVWRLEGSLFEGGVFLQYALGKLAQQAGITKMICGECSDEHQKSRFIKDMFNVTHGKYQSNYRYYSRANPFLTAHSVVLKKSSLMLSSFGIRGCYPFVNTAFTQLASILTSENLNNKRLYKALCQREFPVSIGKKVKTMGGAVDEVSYLSIDVKKKLLQLTNQSKLIQDIYSTKGSAVNMTLDNELVRICDANPDRSKLINTIHAFCNYCKSKLTFNSWQPDPFFYNDEQKCLRESYILLFNELFVTGKYDNMFCKQGIHVGLWGVLNDIVKKQ